MFTEQICICVSKKLYSLKTYSVNLLAGGGQYYSPDFADISPLHKQFQHHPGKNLTELIPAFIWKDGKLYGLAINGKLGSEKEYLYAHFQKRIMNFTPGIENEDSFMIIPNDFVKEHELTQAEIQALMKPSPEYVQSVLERLGWTGKKKPLIERIKTFLSLSKAEKIVRLKLRWNKLLKRKLPTQWENVLYN